MNTNNIGSVGSNWWASSSGRNPGIHQWQPLSQRQGNNVFGQNTAGTSQVFRNNVVQLSDAARALTDSLGNIRGAGSGNSAMQATRPMSGNTDALGIRSFDSRRLNNLNLDNFSIEIEQLAQAQRNEGAALSSSANASQSGFSVGSHQIAITVGNRQFDINFNVSANDTNHDVQQRIAAAINSRNDIGVTASVETEGTVSSLVLASAQTGVSNEGQPNFSVRSVTGNAVEAAGIGEITQQAQDAHFRVNRGFTGALQTSRSNDVSIGFGIEAQLRRTGTVEITMGRDEIAQQNAFREMVNGFNGLVRAARDAGSGSNLSNDLSALGRAFASQLDRIGISINSEGFMRIDEARMAEAATSGELERFASRDGSNFLSRLNRTAENVSQNPAQFVQETGTNSWNNAADFMNSGFNFTPMQSAGMARFMNIGMLFDSLM